MLPFDPETVAPRERFEAWSDFLDRTLMPIRIEPGGEHPFHVKTEMRTVGDLALVSVAGAGGNVVRGSSEIARSPEHFHIISMHLGGEASLTARGNERQLARGDVFLIDTMHEVRFGLERPYQHILVKVPTAWLNAHLPGPDRLFGSVLSHQNALARLSAGYLLTAFQMADQLPRSASAMFSQHLLELLSEAFAGAQPHDRVPTKEWQAVMFVHACRVIALKIGDAALRPNLIAAQLGISTRTLNRIFASHGETVMQHVLKERIKRAAKLLASPRQRHRSITEVALACGFNDLTHFGRVFTEHTGLTPSEWRRRVV